EDGNHLPSVGLALVNGVGRLRGGYRLSGLARHRLSPALPRTQNLEQQQSAIKLTDVGGFTAQDRQ
ncbi:hypothetical protein BaRGS_00029737, partial [Batillaria attramentaria]